MKKRIPLFVFAVALFIMGQATAQKPTVKWTFNTLDASYGQTAAGDIDHDGKLELVFGCYRNDSCVYALNAENGSLLWKYNTHPAGYEGCNDVAPLIYDVDADDSLEVVVPSSCNGVTFCFNGRSGAVKWQTDTYGSDSPPTVADIDNDGKPEILHGEFGGYVICINAEDGSIAWNMPVDTSTYATRINTAPTITDLDADGKPDFVVASWKGDTNKVFAFRGYDQQLLWTYPLRDWVYHGTAVADLDHDNKPELVIGDYSGKLFTLNGEDGSLAWSYTAPSSYYIGDPAAIADLDGDGSCEVVFSAWYQMIALRADSTVFWQYNLPDYGSAFRGVALADIDNDSKPDVLFGSSTGWVIALKGTTGDTLWTIDLAALYGNTFEIDHAPIIADFDDDGILDLFIQGGHGEYPAFQNDYGRGYALSIGVGTGPDWLMFQRDVWRQSSLCEFAISVPEHNTTDAKQTLLYPNPTNGAINIRFANPNRAETTIDIYTANGQLIQSTQPSTATEIQIELKEVANGLYFYTLQTKGEMSAKGKFVKQ
ncbi:MAG: FG-GAP-like repeat-containing protein [Bacteroidota bacterium]